MSGLSMILSTFVIRTVYQNWNTKVPSRTRLDMPMYIETIFSDWFIIRTLEAQHRDGVGA